MPIDPAPDVRISHIGYDRKHTSAEDVNSYFPLERMKEAGRDGKIGHLNERFYGVPTLRSQRLTTERDAPEVLDLCREDRIDAAVLVAT
jgi:D-proline reductase (dithiol) PrdB